MYGWTFPKEELTFSPGIIPAMYQLTESLLTKNEKMLITTPSYEYFTIDFEDFERKAADPIEKNHAGLQEANHLHVSKQNIQHGRAYALRHNNQRPSAPINLAMPRSIIKKGTRKNEGRNRKNRTLNSIKGGDYSMKGMLLPPIMIPTMLINAYLNVACMIIPRKYSEEFAR